MKKKHSLLLTLLQFKYKLNFDDLLKITKEHCSFSILMFTLIQFEILAIVVLADCSHVLPITVKEQIITSFNKFIKIYRLSLTRSMHHNG